MHTQSHFRTSPLLRSSRGPRNPGGDVGPRCSAGLRASWPVVGWSRESSCKHLNTLYVRLHWTLGGGSVWGRPLPRGRPSPSTVGGRGAHAASSGPDSEPAPPLLCRPRAGASPTARPFAGSREACPPRAGVEARGGDGFGRGREAGPVPLPCGPSSFLSGRRGAIGRQASLPLLASLLLT